MSNVSQSLLHPDQYRFGIKSPVLLYSSNYYTILITTYNSINSIDQSLQLTIITQSITLLRSYNWKLHFVNRYCFCNTELRTAIITKIKGLSIQTQQNTFVLFTSLKLTSDERKTLTKISTRKTSHNHSPKLAHALDMKEQENKQTTKTKKRRKGSLHNEDASDIPGQAQAKATPTVSNATPEAFSAGISSLKSFYHPW